MIRVTLLDALPLWDYYYYLEESVSLDITVAIIWSLLRLTILSVEKGEW